MPARKNTSFCSSKNSLICSRVVWFCSRPYFLLSGWKTTMLFSQKLQKEVTMVVSQLKKNISIPYSIWNPNLTLLFQSNRDLININLSRRVDKRSVHNGWGSRSFNNPPNTFGSICLCSGFSSHQLYLIDFVTLRCGGGSCGENQSPPKTSRKPRRHQTGRKPHCGVWMGLIVLGGRGRGGRTHVTFQVNLKALWKNDFSFDLDTTTPSACG